MAASRPAARASTTDAMAPPEDSSETGAEGRDTADTTDATDTDESATSDATPLTLRRMAGTVRWGTKRKIIKARRSKPYQAVRRAVRGGIARQFATKARRDPAVLASLEGTRLVVRGVVDAMPVPITRGQRFTFRVEGCEASDAPAPGRTPAPDRTLRRPRPSRPRPGRARPRPPRPARGCSPS